MKKFYPEFYCLAVIFMFGLIWAVPLKSLTKFLLVQEGVFTMDSYSITGVVLFSIFSGLISYIMAKFHQCLTGKPSNVNFAEFAFIFTFNMGLTTVFIFLGYPLLSFLVNGGIGLYVIPCLVHLYEQGELKVPLTGVKGTYLNAENPEKGAGSISKSELEIEIATSHSNVIIQLRELVSKLKNNNNMLLQINGILSDLDFKTLLGNEVLEGYGNDITKHILWVIIDKHSNISQGFVNNRIGWVKTILALKGNGSSWPEVQQALADLEIKRQNLTLQYKNKVGEINHKNGALMSFKQFFEITNWYTKALSKEANYIENLLNGEIRKDSIYSNGDFKNILNKEYPEIKKTFSDQDSYLRNKISEAYKSHAADRR